jgi:hypothetical protein
MAGKKTAKVASHGKSTGVFTPRACVVCHKPITAAKDYLVVLAMEWVNNSFMKKQKNCHRACVKI